MRADEVTDAFQELAEGVLQNERRDGSAPGGKVRRKGMMVLLHARGELGGGRTGRFTTATELRTCVGLT